jgi:hypothetical protein
MQTRFLAMGLMAIIVVLFNTSCVTEREFRPVTVEEVIKMRPFKVTLEKIDIFHPFIFRTEVDLAMSQDGGNRFSMNFFPANKSIVNFAHSLHEGQSYIFPQVLADYMSNQSTNTMKQ